MIMKSIKKLQIGQLDRKMADYLTMPDIPSHGWIHGIRTAMNMSFRQLAKRLQITPQSAHHMEKREMDGSITLKSLRDAADAMNMKLVYGFVPRAGSIEKTINEQTVAVARKIVMRTDTTMKLEDQAVSYGQIEKSVKELAEEIKQEMPRYLWD